MSYIINEYVIICLNSPFSPSNPPKERIRVFIEQPDATSSFILLGIEYLTAGIAGIQFQDKEIWIKYLLSDKYLKVLPRALRRWKRRKMRIRFRLEAALITLEAPEVWIIRKIMTTQIPVNQTELHLLKNVVNWGFVSQAILKKEESKFKKEKKLALVIKNKQLEKNHDYLLDDNLEDIGTNFLYAHGAQLFVDFKESQQNSFCHWIGRWGYFIGVRF
ncbi:hypothetical protein GLOIN_2v1768391 [Rhizophagus irregularis DAOM 181602=DAOM 197198]|nr:hypothetical protein GLOIN_2v1768391 [Rhizophagus irregularis DAOM 181602=DAOM 197198]